MDTFYKKVVVHFTNPEQDTVFSEVLEIVVPDNGTVVLRTEKKLVTLSLANVTYFTQE